MKIVNAHVHMIELDKMAEKYGDLVLPGGISVLQDVKAALPMLSPDTLMAQMDAAGIEKSILYAVEAPIVYSSNEYVHSLCNAFPDRLIGFASVDPKDPKAPAILETAVREMGMKGLKLHPPLQDFFPNDEAVFDVYSKAVELDIPVVFHVGTTPFGSLCRLSQASPLLIDDVAVRFPELRILLTHLGTLWHNEAFMVVEKNANVFIDTAAYIDEIKQVLTPDMIKRIGPHKVIFGTDYPMPYADRPHEMSDFVDCIGGLDVSQEILQGFFCENVDKLLYGYGESTAGVSIQDMMAKASEFMGKPTPASK